MNWIKSSLAPIYWAIFTFPTAGLAYGLMLLTDWLYERDISGLAAPIRIFIFLNQLGFLLLCLMMFASLGYLLWLNYYRASKGLEAEENVILTFNKFLGLLLIPIGMGLASLLIEVFHNWLEFGERGLGLITIGYIALDWGLQIGSIIVFIVWIIIIPLFLHSRNKFKEMPNQQIQDEYDFISCGQCFHRFSIRKGQGLVTIHCPKCGRESTLVT